MTVDRNERVSDAILPGVPGGPEEDWIERIVPVVEEAIDRLVDRYLQHPFTHRVEHSLHIDLYELLLRHPDLARMYPIGTTGYSTRLVHKEWPETIARPDNKGRRGNFDLAVLTPQQLSQITTIDQFTQGRIPAPIVIELSLGYYEDHLGGDVAKLLNSRVRHPYLVHFSHVRSGRHEETEKSVLRVPPELQIAYVRHDLDQRTSFVKGRADTQIRPYRDEAQATATDGLPPE